MLDADRLISIGYDLTLYPTLAMTTGSGVVQAPELTVSRIAALDQERTDFPLLAHTLPPTATVDGLLGLDFLRGHVLHIDFRIGQLSLT